MPLKHLRLLPALLLAGCASLPREHGYAETSALLEQRVAVADVLRHATNRYRAGYSSYIEQIDAQRALLAVDQGLIQLRADRLNAYVALYQALGGGYSGQ